MSQYQPPSEPGQQPPQQGYPQQPYQQPQWQGQPEYPQQQGYPQYNNMPSQQPPQKPKRGFFRSPLGIGCGVVAALIVLIIVIVAIANAASGGNRSANTSQNTPGTTPTASQPTQPAHTPKWTTVQKFTGNGIKKTALFSVPSDWKIVWSCDPNSFNGFQFNLIVTVTTSDNIPQDVAINALCKKGSTSGETEEHQAGQVYLDINSEGAWNIQVQVLK